MRCRSAKRTTALIVVCLLGASAFCAASSANGVGNVVLGSAAFAEPDGAGWGTAHPARIFNGGDPSGLVTQIHWVRWGAGRAIGYGLNAIFKPRGGYYRQLARIELRADALGKCNSSGVPAYTRLSFRVPARPGGALGKWMLWSGARSICNSGA